MIGRRIRGRWARVPQRVTHTQLGALKRIGEYSWLERRGVRGPVSDNVDGIVLVRPVPVLPPRSESVGHVWVVIRGSSREERVSRPVWADHL